MTSSIRPRRGTLAWLAHQAARGGNEDLEGVVEAHFPEASPEAYQVRSADDGSPADRVDLEGDDRRITYRSYNPPPLWGAPYSVLRARFAPDPTPYFVHHPGEEVIAAVEGRVCFDYAWPDVSGSVTSLTSSAIAEGELARISPQVPHNARSATEGASEAWVVFRDLSDVPASISLNPRISDPEAGRSRRQVTLEDLERPEHYALTAWGLAEFVREQRERVGYTRDQLAHLCDLDPAQVSKLEQGKQNLSIESLARVLRLLRVPIETLLQGATWFMLGPQEAGPAQATTPLARPIGRHFLHPALLDLSENESLDRIDPQHDFETIIVLRGELLVRFGGGDGSVVGEGGVVHARGDSMETVKAMVESKALLIRCGGACTCSA